MQLIYQAVQLEVAWVMPAEPRTLRKGETGIALNKFQNKCFYGARPPVTNLMIKTTTATTSRM